MYTQIIIIIKNFIITKKKISSGKYKKNFLFC